MVKNLTEKLNTQVPNLHSERKKNNPTPLTFSQDKKKRI